MARELFPFGIPHICSVLWFPACVFLRIVIHFYKTVFLPRFLLLGMTKQFSYLLLKCLLFSNFAYILHLPHFRPRAARILGTLKIGFCALVGFLKMRGRNNTTSHYDCLFHLRLQFYQALSYKFVYSIFLVRAAITLFQKLYYICHTIPNCLRANFVIYQLSFGTVILQCAFTYP